MAALAFSKASPIYYQPGRITSIVHQPGRLPGRCQQPLQVSFKNTRLNNRTVTEVVISKQQYQHPLMEDAVPYDIKNTSSPPSFKEAQDTFLAKVCKHYMETKEVPSQAKLNENSKAADTPWIPDLSIYISSLFTKNFSHFMGQHMATATGDEQKKNMYITNIYLMLSMFISTMSVLGVQTRLLPIIFGTDVGNVVDYIYKGAITIAAMTIQVNKPGDIILTLMDKLEFDAPDMSVNKNAWVKGIVAEGHRQNAEAQTGGSPTLYELNVDTLEQLHNRIHTNMLKLLNAVAEMA